MGAAGSLVAAADDPDVAAVIAVAAPADPARLTRQTFRLANLPIPGLIAWPLAWLTTRVYLRPRGHTIASVSATRAVRDIAVPGAARPRNGRRGGPGDRPRSPGRRPSRRAALAVTETIVVPGGRHSWLYEFPAYRAAIGRFLATSLGGPLSSDEAAAIAEAVDARRLPDPERLTTLDEEPGGLRSLTRLVRRHETRAPDPVPPAPTP